MNNKNTIDFGQQADSNFPEDFTDIDTFFLAQLQQQKEFGQHPTNLTWRLLSVRMSKMLNISADDRLKKNSPCSIP